jgi:CheY-like chemotaxis protein
MAQRKRILIVDDIPMMRRMLSKYIHKVAPKAFLAAGSEQIEVLEAEHGEHALQVLDGHPIDLIFLDLMMPDMDGISFLSVKAQDPSISMIPVIVCSAVDDIATMQQAEALGAFSTIKKPFTLRAVEENLRGVASMV